MMFWDHYETKKGKIFTFFAMNLVPTTAPIPAPILYSGKSVYSGVRVMKITNCCGDEEIFAVRLSTNLPYIKLLVFG